MRISAAKSFFCGARYYGVFRRVFFYTARELSVFDMKYIPNFTYYGVSTSHIPELLKMECLVTGRNWSCFRLIWIELRSRKWNVFNEKYSRKWNVFKEKYTKKWNVFNGRYFWKWNVFEEKLTKKWNVFNEKLTKK